MTRKQALQALLEKITAGEFFGDLPRPLEFHTDLCFKAFSGDLNAALSLHEAVRPGEFVSIYGPGHLGDWTVRLDDVMPICNAHAAVAWLIALITGEIERCE